MNSIRLLVLLAATLFAGPFHVGASWEWRVFDVKGNEVAHPIARVVDSFVSSAPRAVVWDIEVVDSIASPEPVLPAVYEFFDSVSGELIERGWAVVPPSFFPLPVGPYSLDRLKQEYGGVFFSLPRNNIDIGYSLDFVEGQVPTLSCEYSIRHFEVGFGHSSPLMNWSESTGWGHFRWLNIYYPKGGDGALDWILVKKDGKEVPKPSESFQLPRHGDIWVWERKETRHSLMRENMTTTTEENFELSELLRMVIDSASEGKDGIVQIQARKVTGDPGSEPDVILSRWRQDSTPSSRAMDCDDLMDGFRPDWMDQPLGDSKFRYYGESWGNAMFDSHRKSQYIQIRANGGVDSLNCAKFGTRFGAYGPSETSTTVTYRLLSINDSVIRAPAWTGVRSRIGLAKVPFDLREFAKAHPDALVKIVGADGRQRTRMARELFGLGSGSSLRVGWFEVRLPDGSVQRGSFTR